MVRKFKSHPEWTRFGAWWMKELARKGIGKKSPLFRICDDLEARIGIAQGKASPPDYRHYLVDFIDERYKSDLPALRRRFPDCDL